MAAWLKIAMKAGLQKQHSGMAAWLKIAMKDAYKVIQSVLKKKIKKTIELSDQVNG